MSMTRLQVQQAISARVQRTDAKVTSNELGAIALAQSYIERHFHPREALAVANVTLTAGVGTLPADFGEADSVANALGILDYESPREFIARGINRATDKCYTITGTQLRTAAATASVSLTYYARPAALTADGSTSWLTTWYEDVLIWCAVAEQHRLVQDWDQAEAAFAYARGLMGMADTASKRAETAGGRMKMRANP